MDDTTGKLSFYTLRNCALSVSASFIMVYPHANFSGRYTLLETTQLEGQNIGSLIVRGRQSQGKIIIGSIYTDGYVI